MEKKYQKRDKYKLNEPILYPPLKQKISNLEIDEDKYNDLGILTMRLLRQNEMSIYRLLYNSESNSEFLTSKNTNKSVRSDYLKKFVEANEDYFPRELLEEKYKKRADLTFEEKLKSKIQLTDNKPKKDKGKKETNKNTDLNRKESVDIPEIARTQNGNKKKLNEPVNLLEEEEDQNEENEEQSFEEDDFLMNSEDEAGSNSEEANYSDGGD